MNDQAREVRFQAMTAGAAHVMAAVTVLAFAWCSPANAQHKEQDWRMNIRVLIDEEVLNATLDDSAAARDFASLLPLDMTLNDYAATEKVADLPRKLSTDGAPRSYKPSSGDITYFAPWGNIAIFYRDFGDSAGLVRLGAFDGSIDALRRDGPITARFELTD